jgi:hypothetical protein
LPGKALFGSASSGAVEGLALAAEASRPDTDNGAVCGSSELRLPACWLVADTPRGLASFFAPTVQRAETQKHGKCASADSLAGSFAARWSLGCGSRAWLSAGFHPGLERGLTSAHGKWASGLSVGAWLPCCGGKNTNCPHSFARSLQAPALHATNKFVSDIANEQRQRKTLISITM